ncbi:MAG: ABC transporter ATP-binding protein [Gammaproteobacteria bacterium]|nr:ABC transporter ATP-binding protein [Gammaproteobacteria bacterium]MDD9816170.1 ABC transporter ATP-binding protein [Gammaproteobacteria bacterium]MDD9871542.1 ABC transporter ATP-binding protein [Gammaproteobacteria bacterium]
MKSEHKGNGGGRLLTMRGLRIDGFTDDQWLPIVKGVDLHLDRGEVLGLIGESGAGKSTIGIAAMGYARPGCRISGGEIDFDGIQILGATPAELRAVRGARIAYVAQSAAASFNPAHRLIDQYAETPVQHGILGYAEAAANAKDIYRRLELPNPGQIGFRYPHQVSGGQLQRAMVAMAMSCQPDLIVFDEPTTALDVTTQIEVLAAIKDIVRQFNTAAIYITHDLAVVAQLADRIMVLRHGLTVEEGGARAMLAAPEEEYTRRLLAVRTFAKSAAGESESATVLEVDNVWARYGGTDAGVNVLEEVSLKVGRKTTVAIVGESGSGKSTLARAITGLLPPFAGRILFNGRELPAACRRRDKNLLRHLQMIYQMPDVALNPRQKIRDVIGRPLSFYFGLRGAERAARVKELLEMIELSDDFKDRYPPELSGGQKQRVCIARALAARPELIICDEVTSALDQLVAEEILKLLHRLQEELGITYLFITHDLATVKAIADEIVVMLQGRIVEHGKKEEVLTPPHHEYTDLLLSSVPEMDPDWLDTLLQKRRAA